MRASAQEPRDCPSRSGRSVPRDLDHVADAGRYPEVRLVHDRVEVRGDVFDGEIAAGVVRGRVGGGVGGGGGGGRGGRGPPPPPPPTPPAPPPPAHTTRGTGR